MDTPLEGVSSGWESKMSRRSRRKFTDEFKAETVNLIRESGRTVGSVARELDMTETAVRNWVKRVESSGSTETLLPDERAELRRLRRESIACGHGLA